MATAIICAIQHDPKRLDACENGYGEPKDHEEAMFTYEQRLKDRVRFNETNILYRGNRWVRDNYDVHKPSMLPNFTCHQLDACVYEALLVGCMISV